VCVCVCVCVCVSTCVCMCVCVCVCVCSLGYPTCNAHAPYCHKWPARFYHIFPHYLINGAIFEQRSLNTKCVFWFYLQLLTETFFIIRSVQRDSVINAHSSSCKVPIILARFEWILNYLYRFSKKILVHQGSRKSVQWGTDEGTDMHGEANSQFSQFFECA